MVSEKVRGRSRKRRVPVYMRALSIILGQEGRRSIALLLVMTMICGNIGSNLLTAWADEDDVCVISYMVDPLGAAQVVGREEVKVGEDLEFTIVPEDGCEIEEVWINGENYTDLETGRDELATDSDATPSNTVASDSNAEKDGMRFYIPNVEEDIDVDIKMSGWDMLIGGATYTKTANDATVTIITADHSFEEEVDLQAKEITKDSDEYIETETKIGESGYENLGFAAYDISFTSTAGDEVEPSGEVNVNINFETPKALLDNEEFEGNTEIHVLHIHDDKVVEIPDVDIKENENAEIETVDFKIDEFSSFVILRTPAYEGNVYTISNEAELREWARTITEDEKDYEGYLIRITDDIDLSGEEWVPIDARTEKVNPDGNKDHGSLLRNVTIDGGGHTISNMTVTRTVNDAKDTYGLGFIGETGAFVPMTIQNLNFEHAYISDAEGKRGTVAGNEKYKERYGGVVVGHGFPDTDGNDSNAALTFSNVTVDNSVVVNSWQSGGILGFANGASDRPSIVFDNCSVTNTFVGGYCSSAGTFFGLGITHVAVRNSESSGNRLYSDGIKWNLTQAHPENGLWTGDVGEQGTLELENSVSENDKVVYPVHFKTGRKTTKVYVPVNTDFAELSDIIPDEKGFEGWYTDSECTNQISQIRAAQDETDMYPYGNEALINDEAYETQNTESVENPQTHAAVTLYSRFDPTGVTLPDPVDWDRSKSKTATNLDENYESDVTLALPAADYKPVVDVVFVVDCSYGSLTSFLSQLVKQLEGMSNELLEKENVSVNIGIVGFANTTKTMFELQKLTPESLNTLKTDVVDRADEYRDWAEDPENEATNLQLGVRVGKDMLDQSTTGALKEDRYMVVMSDGASYYYCRDEEDDTSVSTIHKDTFQNVGNMDGNSDIGSHPNIPGTNRATTSKYLQAKEEGKNFGDFINEQAGAIEASAIGSYSMADIKKAKTDQVLYQEIMDAAYTSQEIKDLNSYPYLNMERATYFSAKELLKVRAEGYQTIYLGYSYFSMGGGATKSLKEVAKGFREWTGTIGQYYTISLFGSSSIQKAFDGIKNELIQVVDAGSTVKDEMGQTAEYNFDFINNAERIRMTVGEETYETTAITEGLGEHETARYGFGKADGSKDGTTYPFVLHYYGNGEDGKQNECFVWDINVPVMKAVPVQLTYGVKLTNPRKQPGIYGEYDADGSKGYAELYTNNSAVLYPVDGYGNKSDSEEFGKPTVSYKVERRDPQKPEGWETSKSKTATNLDENFESRVTLSLPSAQEQLDSDVVLVLDKSTSPALEDQALQMLRDLKTQTEAVGAKVKVGVVIFNKVANVTEWMDLATEYDKIEAAVKQTIESGTNTHAGLIAAKDMLDADTDVEASRKYMAFVSDGISYMYGSTPTVTAWEFISDVPVNWAGPDNWKAKYGSNNPPEDWNTWVSQIETMVEADGTTYDYPYEGTITNCIPAEDNQNHAMSIDKALYLTYKEYQSAKAAGYHCYAMIANTGRGKEYIWGPEFMNYLAEGTAVDFSTIRNDILYLLDAGSYVDDYIGYVADDYDFDFINKADTLALTVGGKTLPVVELAAGTSFAFGTPDANGTYPYVVNYYRGNGTDSEHFVWDINVPVSNFAPVQLTYTVKLMNPKSAAGTYGVYDEDGSLNDGSGAYGLYTNNSAILYPVDSDGVQGPEEEFWKPTVSYTVKENKPIDPEKPDKPDKPDKPYKPGNTGGGNSDGGPSGGSNPGGPGVTIIDEPVPMAPAPVMIPEGEVPLAPLPKTGQNPVSRYWMCLIAGAFLTMYEIIGKRKKKED